MDWGTFGRWSSAASAAWSAASASAQAAWRSAQAEAAKLVATVEASPALAEAKAERFFGLLWGEGGCYERASAWDAELRGLSPDAQRLRILDAAAATGLREEDLQPAAIVARLDLLSLGIAIDATDGQGQRAPASVGIAPVIIGGVVLGAAALAWIWLRSEELEIEAQRLTILERLGASALEGATPAEKAQVLSQVAQVAKATQTATQISAAQGGNTWAGIAVPVVGGLVLLGLGAYAIRRAT